jgi:hypothetical protein
MILLCAKLVCIIITIIIIYGLTCVSVKGIGNLGLFLIVVATGVQNSVAATTTTSLVPEGSD